MINSFDNQSFIAQQCDELRQTLKSPLIANNFGSIDPITPRFKDKTCGAVNWAKLQHYFTEGRKLFPPSYPQTNADPLIYSILNLYYDVPSNQLDQAYSSHLQAMAAENSIGLLLERFIASVLEPHGWIWCSGNIIRAVDFIDPSSGTLLQIKNRDSSENSSSSAIRKGSSITMWFRLFSRRPTKAQLDFNKIDNWANFPLPSNQKHLLKHLNEQEFVKFGAQQIMQLKQ